MPSAPFSWPLRRWRFYAWKRRPPPNANSLSELGVARKPERGRHLTTRLAGGEQRAHRLLAGDSRDPKGAVAKVLPGRCRGVHRLPAFPAFPRGWPARPPRCIAASWGQGRVTPRAAVTIVSPQSIG